MNRQRILVLGCDDAIGRSITDALASSDWATPVVLASEYSPLNPHQQTERVGCKPDDSPALKQVFADVDAIVAAFSGSAESIRRRAAVLFASGPSGWQQQRIVLLSSMTVYGNATGDVDEGASIGANLGAYALSRAESERLAQAYSNVITLRLGVEYGPNCIAWSHRIARWLMAGRIGDLGAFGDGYCNLVYIDDVANAVLKTLRWSGKANQVFNLAAPSPPTWNEYFLRYGEALGAVPVKRITKRRLRIETKLLAPPLKVAEIMGRQLGASWLSSIPAIPPSALGTFAQELKLNAARATSALDLNWTRLEDGLKRTAQWLRPRE
jgi:nucleoside-diphosphate-sugar epimerase